jgi:hypothetical protein
VRSSHRTRRIEQRAHSLIESDRALGKLVVMV